MKTKIIKTRFINLGYASQAPFQWSFYDLSTNESIGPKYPHKDELLADINRFAIERGYDKIYAK